MEHVKKIGLLVGREWSFPPAFLEEVNGRDAGVVAEYVKLGGTKMDEPCGYAVLVDRISHEIPYYRTYLKSAMLQGTYCVNNPFASSADDKFFWASLLAAMGIPSPRTVALPMHSYSEGIGSDSLRNLIYPLDWNAITDYVGMPAILKDVQANNSKSVYKVNTREELVQAYDETGTRCMILQEFIDWDQFVRCLCVGQDNIIPIKYDPSEQRHYIAHEHLAPEVRKQVVNYALRINEVLGYEINSLEFAIMDGVPYVIDMLNPAPDLDINSITPHYFEWAVKALADFCIEMAHHPQAQCTEQRWASYIVQSPRKDPV